MRRQVIKPPGCTEVSEKEIAEGAIPSTDGVRITKFYESEACLAIGEINKQQR